MGLIALVGAQSRMVDFLWRKLAQNRGQQFLDYELRSILNKNRFFFSAKAQDFYMGKQIYHSHKCKQQDLNYN